HPAIVFIEMTNHHHTAGCIACSIAHQVLYRTMNVTGLDIGQRPALGFIINPALDLDTLPNDALLRNHLSHDVRYRTLPKAEYGATLLQPGVSKNFIDQFIELLNIPINARHLFFQSLGRTRGLNHLNTKTNPCHWR